MSTQQVQTCVCEILNLSPNDLSINWNERLLKKMCTTTSTVYNLSLSKVMLKQTEEAARCHICAYLVAEKLSEKYEPDLQYFCDKIPLDPKKLTKIFQLFRQSIWQSSPIKNSSFSPSPLKNSPVKYNHKLSSMDPLQLKNQLFGTPTRLGEPSETQMDSSPQKEISTILSTRRKLAFEDNDDNRPDILQKVSKKQIISFRTLFNNGEQDTEDTDYYSAAASPQRSISRSPKKSETPSPRKKRGEYNQWNMLYKKYYRITNAEIISLCNCFEIPKDIAYLILDCFSMHATYLVFPAQLVCGLVMLCCFIVYHEKRRQDPNIDHYLLKKMCSSMRSNDINDIFEAITITKEVIDGEKWYRDLKVEYDCYDGINFKNAVAIRLGDMLQSSNTTVSNERFIEWKKKIMMDLSLRDG